MSWKKQISKNAWRVRNQLNHLKERETSDTLQPVELLGGCVVCFPALMSCQQNMGEFWCWRCIWVMIALLVSSIKFIGHQVGLWWNLYFGLLSEPYLVLVDMYSQEKGYRTLSQHHVPFFVRSHWIQLVLFIYAWLCCINDGTSCLPVVTPQRKGLSLYQPSSNYQLVVETRECVSPLYTGIFNWFDLFWSMQRVTSIVSSYGQWLCYRADSTLHQSSL